KAHIGNLDKSWRLLEFAVSPDGTRAATVDPEYRIHVWRISGSERSRERTWENAGDGVAIGRIEFSGDGASLIVADERANRVRQFDVETGELVRTWDVQLTRGVCCSPAEPVLVCTCAENSLIAFSSRTGERLWTSPGTVYELHTMVITPDGRHLVTATSDKVIEIRDMRDGELIRELVAHQTSIESLSVSPDGKTLATIETSGRLCLWQFHTGELLFDLPGRNRDVPHRCQFSPDGTSLLYTYGRDYWVGEELDAYRLVRLK
ncbi:MAG: PQQ-binding-like beta-propeller repeat protein, partial [Planctomyces sp.]|nr:PQQ-binding-like beta-propeller repeat protein [Planctomyces sp.]